MNSILKTGEHVSFPAFLAERVYMREFRKETGLPKDLKRWQPTVDQMLDGIETDQPIFLMVDQSTVQAGKTQRRPGLHVDGYWTTRGWDTGRWLSAGHQHVGIHGGHGGHRGKAKHKESIILASDIFGCVGYDGKTEEQAGDGGDASHISVRGMARTEFKPNRAYIGNALMLHESVAQTVTGNRTVVRLNVHGWEASA